MLTSRGLPSDSTCVLKAEPGKLDIKRHESGILFISYTLLRMCEELKSNAKCSRIGGGGYFINVKNTHECYIHFYYVRIFHKR